MIRELQGRLSGRDITLSLDQSAEDLIIEEGYDPIYGARPLKRYIQSSLETLLGRALISGEVTDGQAVGITAADGRLAIKK